ncbi:MAG: hypothetical protein KDC46_05795 [Thermoleophilia bacterium]|nr:hypothetical protein [Thermoleophilia bacterium]
MHITGKQVAIGLGVVAGAVGLAAVLSGCAPKEQDADSFALDKFGTFDREPKDNKWTAGEKEFSTAYVRTKEVDTYRVGDYVFGTREIRRTTTTNSMSRIFDAAKGNDAVLSLQELRDFALKNFDADKNGTLNKTERNHFSDVYAPTSRSRTEIIGREGFSRYSPRNDYPSGGGTGGGTSPGDDYGGGYGGGTGGGTSPGDTGGGYVPPSSGGGTGGGTSPGDSGGGYVPPSNGGSSGGSSGSGNSTDNGNPSDGDF